MVTRLPSAKLQIVNEIKKQFGKINTKDTGLSFGGKGIGSDILLFIKKWFTEADNKTACRFAIVDAKNRQG